MRAFIVLVAASVLAACGDPTLIDGKRYSTACERPAECTAVRFGDQCAPCTCANAAIAVSEKELYEADRTGARQSCGAQPAIACAPCADVTLTCTSGVCGIQ